MPAPPRTARVSLVAIALLAAACTPAAPAGPDGAPSPTAGPRSPVEIKVAFLEDPRDEEARDRVLPAFQGSEVAFTAARLETADPVAVDLVPIDLSSDPTAIEDVARDPTFVAAIIAPDVHGDAVATELTAAGLGVLDLSTYARHVPSGAGAWRRLVPSLRAQGTALGALATAGPVGRRGACLLEDPATAVGLLRPVAAALEGRIAVSASVTPSESAAVVRRAGCRLVVWDGDGSSAAETLLELAAAELDRVRLLGGERLRDASFLDLASDAAERSVSVCGCADVSTSTALPAQRFIQNYQSEYGLPPGPHSVEAWDAAHLLLRALRESEPSRRGVRDWLDRATTFEGLVAVYTFDPDGGLASPEALVRLSTVGGGRWVPLP